MSSLRVHNIDLILPRRPFPPPGDNVRLSFFDALWVSFPPMQRLLLFPDTADIPFSTLIQSLKSSLSDALNLFHPLAGELTYLPSSADITTDCSPAAVGDGVTFITADSDIDINRLAFEANHDLGSFVRLVPELDVRELPARVFAVQITRFVSGGVAVGYAMHHAVVDGRGVWRFLETWAAACRGEVAGPPVAQPFHDRAVIPHPSGNEIARRFTAAMAPNLPRITGTSTASLSESRLQLTRRTFTITANTIKSLKQAAPSSSPTTFVALSAHAWISFANAKAIADSEPTTHIFTADCRSRLDPPISETFTGNCVRVMYVNSTGGELRGADGLEWACTAIRKSLEEFLEEPLARCEDWADDYLRREKKKDMYVVGSPWFKAYEIDFGFGRPWRAELVSMNQDGEVVLLGGVRNAVKRCHAFLFGGKATVFCSAGKKCRVRLLSGEKHNAIVYKSNLYGSVSDFGYLNQKESRG